MPKYELTVIVSDDAEKVSDLFEWNGDRLNGDTPFRSALRTPTRWLDIRARVMPDPEPEEEGTDWQSFARDLLSGDPELLKKHFPEALR